MGSFLFSRDADRKCFETLSVCFLRSAESEIVLEKLNVKVKLLEGAMQARLVSAGNADPVERTWNSGKESEPDR